MALRNVPRTQERYKTKLCQRVTDHIFYLSWGKMEIKFIWIFFCFYLMFWWVYSVCWERTAAGPIQKLAGSKYPIFSRDRLVTSTCHNFKSTQGRFSLFLPYLTFYRGRLLWVQSHIKVVIWTKWQLVRRSPSM